jgi:flavin reductase (DIM6/NTAB) family NADH-FMN oxidoreductase RutF
LSGNGDAFDTLIAGLDPAMAIVTTVSDNERGGCLIGFHAQCSIDPPRYVVWLSKANHTFRVALHAQHFAVHFLPEDISEELPRLFGTVSGDDADKFARCSWDAGPGGVPLLRDLPHRFTAERVALLDEGSDHVCLVVSPTGAEAPGAFRPLRLSQVEHLQPGHEAEERPEPATERAG